MFDDVLVTYTDGASEDSVSLPAEDEFSWDITWRLRVGERFGREFAKQCKVVAVRYPDGELVESDD